MTKKLIEAINVPGAEHIGTAWGYDVFDIRTYEAAQQFVVENTTSEAGDAYTQNEQTFNANINENQRLYFFVESNTNHVYSGAVKSDTTQSSISIYGENCDLQLNVNFLFEVNTRNKRKIFPFFLIPNIHVDNATDNLIVSDRKLLAVLPQLTSEDTIDLDLSVMTNIDSIDEKAFSYHMHINQLMLGDNIQDLGHVLFSDVDHIQISWIEKPAG